METFSRISPNQELFFKNPALSLFYLYSPLSSCKKSEKSFEPFLRKLRHQPTNYQQHRSYRASLTPVQQIKNSNGILDYCLRIKLFWSSSSFPMLLCTSRSLNCYCCNIFFCLQKSEGKYCKQILEINKDRFFWEMSQGWFFAIF